MIAWKSDVVYENKNDLLSQEIFNDNLTNELSQRVNSLLNSHKRNRPNDLFVTKFIFYFRERIG